MDPENSCKEGFQNQIRRSLQPHVSYRCKVFLSNDFLCMASREYMTFLGMMGFHKSFLYKIAVHKVEESHATR
jgi:hypothetical protein